MLTQDQIDDAAHIWDTRFVGFASFSILLWDHILTFGDEVEYIWKRKKGPLGFFFLLNRYIMPLGFIVNLVAYTDQSWPQTTCDQYVRYEGAMTAIGIEIVGVMMLLRIHALYYDKSRLVIGTVAFILIAETGTNIYLLIGASPVQHIQPFIRSCSMVFHAKSPAASGSAWIPLLYDTVVLILTLYRTLPSIRSRETQAGDIVSVILRDGILYYSLICAVTLALTVMIKGAPPGIQNIAAQLELLITVTMMSRITLHLKKQAHSQRHTEHAWERDAVVLSFTRDRSGSDSTAHTRDRSGSSSTRGFAPSPTFAKSPQSLCTIHSERSLEIPMHEPTAYTRYSGWNYGPGRGYWGDHEDSDTEDHV